MENKIVIEKAGQELIIREGKALELKEPRIISLSGDIRSISAFLKKRWFIGDAPPVAEGDGSQAVSDNTMIVEVDKAAMTITLKLDPENHYGTTVQGKLENSEELKAFNINGGETFTREQLVKIIRFNKRLFENADKHAEVLKAYQTFNASAHVDLAAASDNRGNRSASIDKKVTTGLPNEFIMKAPIFKGEKEETFRVELCLDVTDGGARFWFESVELHELKEKRLEEIFAEELKCCSDFVVINK